MWRVKVADYVGLQITLLALVMTVGINGHVISWQSHLKEAVKARSQGSTSQFVGA